MSDPDAQWGMEPEDDWTPSACAGDARAPAPTPLQMATPQLLELAGAVRGQPWRDQLAPALVAARDAGWDWPRRALAACRLIFDPDGEPRTLTEAARSPVARGGGRSDPQAEWRAARQALEAGKADR